MIISSQTELEKNIKLNHFKLNEIECHHCHFFPLTEDSKRFLLLLDEFRTFISNVKNKNIPLMLTNVYRCPLHNEAVGSKPGSAHVQAIAADIYSELQAVDLFYFADLFNEFSGIGIYHNQNFDPKQFIHVDIKRRQLKKQYWVNINGKETLFETLKNAWDYFYKNGFNYN